MIIYLITNKVNNKIYIGKTIESLRRRWVVHRSHAKTRAHTPLHKAIRKYGEHNFVLEVISSHNTVEEMDNAEIDAIKKFNSNDKKVGYNLTSGGGAPIGNSFMKGHRHTKKTRKKMAKAHRGLKFGTYGIERRKKISQALIGIVRGPMPEEIKLEKSTSTKNSWKERRKKYGVLGSSRTRQATFLKTSCAICGSEIVYKPNGKNYVPKTCSPDCLTTLRRNIIKRVNEKIIVQKG